MAPGTWSWANSAGLRTSMMASKGARLPGSALAMTSMSDMAPLVYRASGLDRRSPDRARERRRQARPPDLAGPRRRLRLQAGAGRARRAAGPRAGGRAVREPDGRDRDQRRRRRLAPQR